MISFFVFRHTQSFVQTASHARGTVSKLNERDGEKVLYPVFTFEDSHGTSYSIESSSGSYPTAYKIGDLITVIYQPDKPANAKIDSFLDIWIWPIALVGCGALDLLFGIGILVIAVVIQKSERKLAIAKTS